MKTPEQIARDMLDEHVRGVRSDITDAALIAWMTRAIEADRAQRTRVHMDPDLDPQPWLFISDQIFGEFRSDHDKGCNNISGTWWAFEPRPGYNQNREELGL